MDGEGEVGVQGKGENKEQWQAECLGQVGRGRRLMCKQRGGRGIG